MGGATRTSPNLLGFAPSNVVEAFLTGGSHRFLDGDALRANHLLRKILQETTNLSRTQPASVEFGTTAINGWVFDINNIDKMNNQDYSIKINGDIQSVLVQLVLKQVPALATYIKNDILQDRGRVFSFLVTKGLWYKVRLFKINWVKICKSPFSGVQLADVQPLDKDSLEQIDSEDLLTDIDSVNLWIKGERDRLKDEQINEETTCTEIFLPRFRVYNEHMEGILEGFSNAEASTVLVNRVIKYNGDETYHLYVTGLIGNRRFYARFVETQSDGMCKLHFDTRQEDGTTISQWEWMPEHALNSWEETQPVISLLKNEIRMLGSLDIILRNRRFSVPEGEYFDNENEVFVSEWSHEENFVKLTLNIYNGVVRVVITFPAASNIPVMNTGIYFESQTVQGSAIQVRNFIDEALARLNPTDLAQSTPLLIPPVAAINFGDFVAQGIHT